MNDKDVIIDDFYLLAIPFLSIAVFFGMEFLSKGVEFFVDKHHGVRWRFLFSISIIQVFISIIILLATLAIFKSDYLAGYKTFQNLALVILGTTPFNISILVWVAVKLEIYQLMRNRYGDEFKGIEEQDDTSDVAKVEDSKDDAKDDSKEKKDDVEMLDLEKEQGDKK